MTCQRFLAKQQCVENVTVVDALDVTRNRAVSLECACSVEIVYCLYIAASRMEDDLELSSCYICGRRFNIQSLVSYFASIYSICLWLVAGYFSLPCSSSHFPVVVARLVIRHSAVWRLSIAPSYCHFLSTFLPPLPFSDLSF